jgi:hypothetical protein
MVAMYASELGCTGSVSTRAFQMLSAGNTWHPAMTGGAFGAAGLEGSAPRSSIAVGRAVSAAGISVAVAVGRLPHRLIARIMLLRLERKRIAAPLAYWLRQQESWSAFQRLLFTPD